MEKGLVVWRRYQSGHSILVKKESEVAQSCLIQSNALSFFSIVRAERDEEASEEKFEASRDWFMRFKARIYLHNIKMQVPVQKPLWVIANIINEDGHCKQILSVDERALYWKKMPSRIFIAREKSLPDFKASKIRWLLLGAPTTDALKLKPELT